MGTFHLPAVYFLALILFVTASHFSFLTQLCKYVDELVIPQTVDAASGKVVHIGAYKIQQKLHRDLPPTTLYAFGTSLATASVPGPTFEATRNVATKVKYTNQIPDPLPMLPVDDTLMWAKPVNGGVPIVVHFHGGEVESASDGHPDAWFTPSGEKGKSYSQDVYTYANIQRSTFAWYHDHVVGITRVSVLSGLAGMYILRDPKENFALPSANYELPLMLGDKTLNANGSIFFPVVGDNPDVHPEWEPEFFGDVILVNGKAWPYKNVEPRKYFIRLLNGANARFFTLSFRIPNSVSSASSLVGGKDTARRLNFQLVGTDGGLLPRPQTMGSLRIAPGERASIVVDFSQVPSGTEILLMNHAVTPYPSGAPPTADTKHVMKFLVRLPLKGKDTSHVPPTLRPIPPLDVTQAVNYPQGRLLTLTETEDDVTGSPLHSLLEGLHWNAPVTIKPREGTTELWRIINLTQDVHPIHIHLVQHRVVSRQPFDVEGYTNNTCSFADGSCYSGPATRPEQSEIGWKDTTQMPPGQVTTVLLTFSPQDGGCFPFNATQGPGYVWHCHILDHEDNDMMRPYQLLPALPSS